ncbi:MAG: hypothetical protein ACJA1C_002167 [Crocinitomicaceae bacterium]|jgi:hypothetical protein
MTKLIFILTLFLIKSLASNSQIELIQNGDFGIPCCVGISWTSTPDFYYNINYSNWHSNPGYAYLSTSSGNAGNNLSGAIYQTISGTPSNISSGTVSFWYSVSTSETTNSIVYDEVVVQLNINGVIHEIGSFSNLDNTNGAYIYYSANLSPTVVNALNNNSNAQVLIEGSTDGGSPSALRIDDISILVNTSSGVADVTVYTMNVDPDSGLPNPQVGEDVDLEVEITNIGNSDLTTDFNLSYFIDGVYVDDDPVNGSDIPMVPGAVEFEQEINYIFTSPGTYQYCVTIDNHPDETNYSNNSQCITVNVVSGCTPITITQHPINQTVTSSNTSTFSVSSTGTLPITYQWKKNNINISGATSSSYTTPTLTISDDGNLYKCEMTNCDGTVESNSGLLTVNSIPSVQEFELDNTLSHLRWPFPNSNWSDDINNPIRDTWKGGTEGTGASGHGDGVHLGHNYFSDDWNRDVFSGGDCDEEFLSPMTGTVIYTYTGSNPVCTCWSWSNPIVQAPCGLANQVVIQSDDDPDFAFSILHLNSVLVSDGQSVSVSTPLGTIGSTGASNNSHAHCTLYKNITDPYVISLGNGLYSYATAQFYLDINGKIPNGFVQETNHSGNFKFDATFNNPGSGGSPNNPITTSNQSFVICEGDSTNLVAPLGDTYAWSTGQTTQEIFVSYPGVYSVYVVDGVNDYIETITVSEFTYQEPNILSSPANLCTGETVTLYLDNPALTILTWSNSSTDQNIIVATQGEYFVESTDAYGCFTASDTIQILEFPNPVTPIISVNTNQLASSSISGASYHWYYMGDTISNANSQFHIATQEGYYTVEATNQYGCTSMSNPVYISSSDLGIESNSLESVVDIYPNPTTGKITIEMKNGVAINNLEIFNSLGQVIWKNNSTIPEGPIIVSLPTISGAICFVHIETDQGKIVQKIILNK